MTIDGVKLDLLGLERMPGLINAHDHMEFALFPRLGRGPYANATAWARDIYHPQRSPIAEHLNVPKPLRLLWGGLRNLLAGVTTVCEHNPYHPVFDDGFPVHVIKRYGWAHSLEFDSDLRARYLETPPGAPFVIHAGEGTDSSAREEVFKLDHLGVLGPNTVLVHSVAWDDEGWNLLRQRGTQVITCPRSNLFTLGKTLTPVAGIALGTDSALSADGDMLDEIATAQLLWGGSVREMATSNARHMLRMEDRPGDFIAAERFGDPPELVVIGGDVSLISLRLADQLTPSERRRFSKLQIEGRPPVLVHFDIPSLVTETRRYLNGPLRLAGREVIC